jgi:hypothetical protein
MVLISGCRSVIMSWLNLFFCLSRLLMAIVSCFLFLNEIGEIPFRQKKMNGLHANPWIMLMKGVNCWFVRGTCPTPKHDRLR